jgi:hypothetical protein
VTAGVLQQACDCVLSDDIVVVCIDMPEVVGLATGELMCAIGYCASFETVVREADLKSEDWEFDVG